MYTIILFAVTIMTIVGSQAVINSTASSIALESPSLKELAAQKNIEIGNFAIRNLIHENEYKHILTSQFSVALADNTPNWYFTDGGLRPTKDTYFFDHMDEVVGYAETHSMKIQAHHYLWGEEKWLPDWLKKGNYSQADLDTIIEEHIMTVGSRYSGRIAEWTVVNEAFSRGQGVNGLRDWWADATGSKDYIDTAFIIARKADPDSTLLLNDFGNETENAISNEMYDYIKSAKNRDVPIDGIGMQMHINGNSPPSKQEVIDNMNRFADIGVPVYVTELDVTMSDVPGPGVIKDAKQAEIYYDMARACIEAKNCKSFALLGITDKETWYNYMGVDDPRPLPFDANYNPKPAYYSLHKAFSE